VRGARMRWGALAALLSSAALAVPAGGGVEDIDGFHRIDAKVAVGATPAPAQVAGLAEAGFRSLLNLREESEIDSAPVALAAKDAGLTYLRAPISSKQPTDAAATEFLRITDEASIYPVFIYCASGNRAAALWMVRRVLRDGWTLEAAQAEAERAGLTSPAMREFALGYIERHATERN